VSQLCASFGCLHARVIALTSCASVLLTCPITARARRAGSCTCGAM
jgi:hypothetical protein